MNYPKLSVGSVALMVCYGALPLKDHLDHPKGINIPQVQ